MDPARVSRTRPSATMATRFDTLTKQHTFWSSCIASNHILDTILFCRNKGSPLNLLAGPGCCRQWQWLLGNHVCAEKKAHCSASTPCEIIYRFKYLIFKKCAGIWNISLIGFLWKSDALLAMQGNHPFAWTTEACYDSYYYPIKAHLWWELWSYFIERVDRTVLSNQGFDGTILSLEECGDSRNSKFNSLRRSTQILMGHSFILPCNW